MRGPLISYLGRGARFSDAPDLGMRYRAAHLVRCLTAPIQGIIAIAFEVARRPLGVSPVKPSRCSSRSVAQKKMRCSRVSLIVWSEKYQLSSFQF